MNTKRMAWLCTFCALAAACGGSREEGRAETPQTGGLTFQMDASALGDATGPTMTAATATLSRDGHATIEKSLTIANGIATGQVDGLEPGYWHVVVDVFQDTTPIYTGAADVNVIAGLAVQCNILFDPVVVPPTTGSVVITVGLNPMPGYSVINQVVSDVLLDRANRILYVLDGTTQMIGVYDATTLRRTRDLALPGAPLSTALTPDGSAIYLGYASGHVRKLDVTSGATAVVADVLMQALGITALDGSLIMVRGDGSYYANVKVVNTATGQVVSSRAPFYSLAELLYNPLAKTVYSHHVGVSPTDIHYLKLDAAGSMLSDGDSIYHGDYAFGRPLRLLKNGTRIATSSGAMFTSAELVADDLRYAGSLGYSYVDLWSDDSRGKLYLLNAAGIPKLVVIDQETYFVDLTVDLSGTPTRVWDTPESIIVFSTKDARTYARSFAKVDLGI